MPKKRAGGPERPPQPPQALGEAMTINSIEDLDDKKNLEKSREIQRRLRAFSNTVTRRFIDGGDEEWAKEIFSRTIHRAYERAHQFEEGTQLMSWLYRIAQNIAIDMVRAGRLETLIAEPLDVSPDADTTGRFGVVDFNPEILAVSKDELEKVRAAIATLPMEYQSLLKLLEEGLSYKEMAEVEGIPLGTVMSRIARARRNLRRLTGRGAAEEGGDDDNEDEE